MNSSPAHRYHATASRVLDLRCGARPDRTVRSLTDNLVSPAERRLAAEKNNSSPFLPGQHAHLRNGSSPPTAKPLLPNQEVTACVADLETSLEGGIESASSGSLRRQKSALKIDQGFNPGEPPWKSFQEMVRLIPGQEKKVNLKKQKFPYSDTPRSQD